MMVSALPQRKMLVPVNGNKFKIDRQQQNSASNFESANYLIAKYAELAEKQRKLGPARSQKNSRYATNVHWCSAYARILGVSWGVLAGGFGILGRGEEFRWWLARYH
jgi:hypothetical protein